MLTRWIWWKRSEKIPTPARINTTQSAAKIPSTRRQRRRRHRETPDVVEVGVPDRAGRSFTGSASSNHRSGSAYLDSGESGKCTLRPREDAYAFAGVVGVLRADLATTSGYAGRRNREAQVERGSDAAEGRPTPNAWLCTCRRRKLGRGACITTRVIQPISQGRRSRLAYLGDQRLEDVVLCLKVSLDLDCFG